MLLVWDTNAWDDYLWWQTQDRKVLQRINLLIQDIQRNGNSGIGKPEPLKHDFAGYWSRRITDEHRLIYKLTDSEIRIAACRYHYGRYSQHAEGDWSGWHHRKPIGLWSLRVPILNGDGRCRGGARHEGRV